MFQMRICCSASTAATWTLSTQSHAFRVGRATKAWTKHVGLPHIVLLGLNWTQLDSTGLNWTHGLFDVDGDF